MSSISPTRRPTDWAKYVLSFIITALVFGTALYVNNLLDQKRVGNAEIVRDQIALDLISSETQYNLLRDTSCNASTTDTLSVELNSLAIKLGYMEANDLGQQNAELIYLKKYYSLLEIKDYLLFKQLQSRCGLKPLSILYFYGNENDCPECKNTAIVLDSLRSTYPELRIYSFDTKLDLSALNTLENMFKISSTELPALVIKDKSYVGFKSIEEIKTLLPELKEIDKARAKAKLLEARTSPQSKTPTSPGSSSTNNMN